MKRIGLMGITAQTSQILESIQHLEQYQCVGYFDPEASHEKDWAKQKNLKRFLHPIDLIAESDLLHFGSSLTQFDEYASLAIRSSRHLFLDAQYITQWQQAERLNALAEEAQVKVDIVRHDRFNAAVLKAREYVSEVRFIETRRAVCDAQADVFELLLRDIDLVISFVNSDVKRIQSRSSNAFDRVANMVNVRIEFDNGCVANLNLSTLSNLPYSKMALYEHQAVTHIDLEKLQVEVLNQQDGSKPIAQLNLASQHALQNQLQLQLQNFDSCIDQNLHPDVGLYDTLRAIKILEEVKRQLG